MASLKRYALGAALALALLTAPAVAQEMSAGDQFTVRRIGQDALTVRDLLNELAAAKAKAAELQAQIDKAKKEAEGAPAPPKD